MPAERSTPVELLMLEHCQIERVLDALSQVAARLDREDPLPPRELEGFVRWLRYADAIHHTKEEDVLFAAMIASGVSRDDGPIAMMVAQHEEGRRLVTQLADAASRAEWTAETRRRAAVAATDFVALQRQHIQLEDDILYPMARAMIRPATWETIEHVFDELAAAHAAEHATLEALSAALISRYHAPGLTTEPPSDLQLRPLTGQDLDAVVELDQRLTTSSRSSYFGKRLAAALRHPKRHLQLAATTPAGLVGFVLARAVGDEFGRRDEVLTLEAIGVDPATQHAGVGRRMMAELERLARARGMTSVSTQVDWRDHAMLRFLDGAKFKLATELLLERRVNRMPLPPTDEEIETPPPLVRQLRASDLDGMRQIDRQLTGRDRTAYLQRKLDEALHESAIAMSLVAEDDGFVVAFATVHVDFGDFGHMEPVASLETIGVNPGFAHRGFARAILVQLIDNLAALHVERLETEVARDNFPLLQFLYRFGFGASERLPLVHPL